MCYLVQDKHFLKFKVNLTYKEVKNKMSVRDYWTLKVVIKRFV